MLLSPPDILSQVDSSVGFAHGIHRLAEIRSTFGKVKVLTSLSNNVFLKAHAHNKAYKEEKMTSLYLPNQQ